jgi:hypothetical protein
MSAESTRVVIIRCRITYEQYIRLLDEAKLEEQSASELVRRGIDLVTKLRAKPSTTAA